MKFPNYFCTTNNLIIIFNHIPIQELLKFVILKMIHYDDNIHQTYRLINPNKHGINSR